MTQAVVTYFTEEDSKQLIQPVKSCTTEGVAGECESEQAWDTILHIGREI